MMAEARTGHLLHLSPGQIRPNHENPRLVFRQEEMEQLMVSIDKHGIQVPLTVFEDGGAYTLIDGERRWRCATKLNLKSIPAIVQTKPSELQNLILMYNIHALREQWDYYTIASKLERVIELNVIEKGFRPGEAVLSEMTGLTRGAIRRCYLLIDLPDRFKDLLVAELDKPKSQQRLSEDLFIELEKSLKTVTKRLPEYQARVEVIRDTLVEKFNSRVITAVTDFRQLSKIATAVDTLGVSHKTAQRALDRVFDPADRTGIKEAYTATVQFEYGERRAVKSAEALNKFLLEVIEHNKFNELDEEFIGRLRELAELLERLRVA
jgi:ParB family chromosome partitioning protein